MNEQIIKTNELTVHKTIEMLKFSRNIRISRAVGTGQTILLASLMNELFKENCRILFVSSLKILNEQLLSTIYNQSYYNLDFLKAQIGLGLRLTIKRNLQKEIEDFNPTIIIASTVSNDNEISKSEIDMRIKIDTYVLEVKTAKVIYIDSSIDSIDPLDHSLNVIVRPQLNMNFMVEYQEHVRLLFDNYEAQYHKLQEKSKVYLVTAQILFGQLLNYGDKIDYSSVVLMWMKAFELELKKYFYTDLIGYLDQCETVDDNRPKGLDRTFTLGSIDYILMDSEYNKCEQCLTSYFLCTSSIKQVSCIRDFLRALRSDVKKIRVNYRNKASHTGSLELTEAIGCYNMLIYIEKVFLRLLQFIG
jgi:hypothetical protein